MEVMHAVSHRRSIRRFKSTPLPREDIEKMVQAAALAPSGGNVQPWHFLAITNQGKRDEMISLIHNRGLAVLHPIHGENTPRFILPSLVFSTAPLVFAVLFIPFPLDKDPGFLAFQKNHTENKQQRLEKEKKNNMDAYGGFVNIQSVAAAIENLLLRACDLGYGSCWLRIPYYAKDDLEEFLQVSSPWELLALIPVGIPDQNPSPPPRKHIEEILTYLE